MGGAADGLGASIAGPSVSWYVCYDVAGGSFGLIKVDEEEPLPKDSMDFV